jgi:tetratricopeptide (TPR) repeat protein
MGIQPCKIMQIGYSGGHMMTISRQQTIGIIVGAVLVAILAYAIWLVAHPTDPYSGLTLEREISLDEATRIYFEQRLDTTLAAIAASEAAGKEVDLSLYLSVASDAYSLGDLVTAREMLELQIAGNPINYVAWNNYALVLEDMGDYENAENAYLKTIEIEQGIGKYYEDYADFLSSHFPERSQDLRAVLEEDLTRRGQTVWNMTALGDWYAAEGECDKAVDHYEVAVVLSPTNQALKDDMQSLEDTCQSKDE